MPTANKIEVNISGDNYGNIIIGDNNIVGTPHGIKVTKKKSQTIFERRTKPVNFRPRAFSGLLGRASELQNIQNAIINELPVTLFGENGIGKTSLIREASHLEESNKYKDGVIYLNARNEERNDLLQQIFDSIYSSTPNHKPTDAQIRTDLKNIHALIFLDDLSLQREDVNYLLDAMPKSLFILSSDKRALWGEGQALGLDGLPESEAIQLFERELGRKLLNDEKPVAIQVCKILLFHPLRILQSASLMREDGQSIQQVFTSLTKTQTQSAPLEVTLQKSNETQKKILSLLAVAGGFALTREHLAKLAGAKTFDVDMQSLLGRGLVEAQGASFSLSNESVKSLVQLWDLSGWEDTLINHFSNWLQTAPQEMLVDQVANTLFHLIQRAGEKKQWNNVVAIGKRLEQLYAMKKKWDGWLKILKLIQLAAKYLKDQFLEGWATHQIGSRALCLDLKTEAGELLNQALKIRKTIGDKGGLQVTQHNLNVLMNVPVAKTVKPQTGNIGRILLIGGIAGTILLIFVFGGIILFSLLPEAATSTPFVADTEIPPTATIHITDTPIISTPTFSRPTFNPSPTKISTPIVLYDFVREADNAEWEIIFFYETIYETYSYDYEFVQISGEPISSKAVIDGADTHYIGWERDVRLEDESRDELALVVIPSSSVYNVYLNGYYNDTRNLVLQAGDRFVARVGYVNPFTDFPLPVGDGVRFEVVMIDEFATEYTIYSELIYFDGVLTEIEIDIPKTLHRKSGVFVLKVYSDSEVNYDWAAWVDAELYGLPR